MDDNRPFIGSYRLFSFLDLYHVAQHLLLVYSKVSWRAQVCSQPKTMYSLFDSILVTFSLYFIAAFSWLI